MTVGFNSQKDIYYGYNNVRPSNNISYRGHVSNELPNDTVEISSKKNNSNKTSWFLTGLITTAFGLFAYLKVKKKPPEIKQLAEHIDFKEFKTVEEAVNFTKENFGVKLDTGGSLQLANFVNKRLVKYNNVMKGSVVLPEKIVAKSGMKTIDGEDALMGWGNWGVLRINKELAEKKLQSRDKSQLLYMIKAFNHELGHANHQAVCKDYEKMGNLKELKQMFITDRHYYDDFMNDIKNNKVVQNYCTKYSLTSPCEFVADIFADKLMGNKIPPEVEKLYKKYGGRDVPGK